MCVGLCLCMYKYVCVCVCVCVCVLFFDSAAYLKVILFALIKNILPAN